MGTWRNTRPDAGDEIKNIPALTQDNFDAIEDIISTEHQTFVTIDGSTDPGSGRHKPGQCGVVYRGTAVELADLDDVPLGALGFDTTNGLFLRHTGTVWKRFGQDEWSRVRSYPTSAMSITADSAAATAIFDTENYDTLEEYDTATGLFTAKASGSYAIICSLSFVASGSQALSGAASAVSGVSTSWAVSGTAASGMNYLAIDEYPTADDTDFVTAKASGSMDYYAMGGVNQHYSDTSERDYYKLERYNAANYDQAQGFKLPEHAIVTQFSWYGGKSGTPAQPHWFEIQSDSGSGFPSGTVITSSCTASEEWLQAGGWEWHEIYFPTPVPLSADTQYHMVWKTNRGISTSNYTYVGDDQTETTSGNYAGGYMSTYSDTTSAWSRTTSGDWIFKIWTRPWVPPGSTGIGVKVGLRGRVRGCTCDDMHYGFTTCSCDSTCYGDTTCSCDSSCDGYVSCSCDSSCDGYVSCSCDSTCYNEVPSCVCNYSCYEENCTCNGQCYGDTACSCDSSCDGYVSCSCDSTAYLPVTCYCDSTTYGWTGCSCDNTCYLYYKTCTCNNTCYGYSCTCHGSCYGYAPCTCNNTCYGNITCSCDATCYGYISCSCNYTFYGTCTCENTCYQQGFGTCECYAQCYGYTNCTCNDTCYGHTTCSCDQSCYGYVSCSCDAECYEYLLCSCDVSCYGEEDALPAPLLVIGSTTYPGTACALTADWTDVDNIFYDDPSTDSPWTVSGVNSIQYFGYDLYQQSETVTATTSSGCSADISQAYLTLFWFPLRPVITMGLHKNGSSTPIEAVYHPLQGAGAHSDQTVQLYTILRLNAGDTLQVRVSKTLESDTLEADSTATFLAIHRLSGVCL